ncbi:hypothetical protein RchiOBHm_Chr5g0031051 [Rosa chinensis]|uniref:Uncharacterized protein n=1 Tax=Rosa chinensis TaxID=74649 RepID=A0A2P6QA55_ROSCH|nr:hypothetical protein RchiOBHm_Chr5g0031051 [Rosa chinensis]
MEVHAYFISLYYSLVNSSAGGVNLSRPKYNTTLSFLRLDIDGNVRIYAYDDKVDWGAWELTFTLFD